MIETFTSLDLSIQSWMLTHQVDSLTAFFRVLTYMGSPLVFLFLTLMLVGFLLTLNYYKDAFYLGTGMLITWTLMHYMKIIIARARPEGNTLTIATGYSFPSGHAMVSIFFYGFLAYLLYQRSSSWARYSGHSMLVLIILIGLSRMYLNVHYFTDVAAGFLLGGICLYAIIKVSARHRTY